MSEVGAQKCGDGYGIGSLGSEVEAEARKELIFLLHWPKGPLGPEGLSGGGGGRDISMRRPLRGHVSGTSWRWQQGVGLEELGKRCSAPDLGIKPGK